MKNSKALIFLSVVMLVNSISYGTIIPLLYPFAERFGVGPLQLSWLITSFSLAQFLATPIIGRLSDRYGRKPLLLISLLGSSLSLVLFAMSENITMLFLSRILDGVTGGNYSVAQAVIADSTQEGKERTKAYGILGASFGVGFLLGPAIGGFMSKISLSAPFWFAAGLALLGVLLGLAFLTETNTNQGKASREPLFNFKAMIKTLSAPVIGTVLLVSFLATIAQNSWVIGFQSFTVDELKLDTTTIGLIFSLIGLTSIIVQGVGIRVLLDKVSNKKLILQVSLLLCTIVMGLLGLTHSLIPFLIVIVFYSIVSAPLLAVTSSLLSEGTRAEDQGGIMGINQSYSSLGQIIGPLLAGVIAERSINAVFLLSGLMIGLALLASQKLGEKAAKPVNL
ncbi:MFS transporter [Candidatus Beckwithbacteria bacterium]|nr:MFS transporter [Candidatus Beckwithbacteria bacterium]